MPITNCEAERSFSRMSYIKNKQRNTMSDDRLADLMLLSIEHKITKSLNYDEKPHIFISIVNTYNCSNKTFSFNSMDSKRTYMSGARKRKLKKEANDRLRKNNKKISLFFSSVEQKPSEEVADKNINVVTSTSQATQQEEMLSVSINLEHKEISKDHNESRYKSNAYIFASPNNLTTAMQVEETDPEPNIFQELNTLTTDMGYFKGKFFDDSTKRFIISSERCKPKGPFKKDPSQNFRHFSTNYCAYKFGRTQRFWLCYSKILDSAYCEPCWLFSNDKNNPWRTGVRDWKGLSKKIKSHANSLKHIEACQVYDHWKQKRTLNEDTETIIRHKASFWKMVLERLFNITLMLTKNSLAFRGHSEVLADEIYNGNFLSDVYLLSKYDDTMKQVLNKPKGTIKYLSPK
ncbi:uncharacterized protein LOC136074256 [Hydra vulgaris]|uniref:Uncharacterized protein LOC136074256 n=1 Tax=Hydra vulgaris TaxID=6087 RepID=A0ABM4B1I8_HYDVU